MSDTDKETLSWWEPVDLWGNTSVRAELLDSLPQVFDQVIQRPTADIVTSKSCDVSRDGDGDGTICDGTDDETSSDNIENPSRDDSEAIKAFRSVPTGFRDQRRILKKVSDEQFEKVSATIEEYLRQEHPDLDISDDELDYIMEMSSNSPASDRPVAHRAFTLIDKLMEADVKVSYFAGDDKHNTGASNRDWNQQAASVGRLIRSAFKSAGMSDRIRTSKSCDAAYDGDGDGTKCDGTDDETSAEDLPPSILRPKRGRMTRKGAAQSISEGGFGAGENAMETAARFMGGDATEEEIDELLDLYAVDSVYELVSQDDYDEIPSSEDEEYLLPRNFSRALRVESEEMFLRDWDDPKGSRNYVLTGDDKQRLVDAGKSREDAAKEYADSVVAHSEQARFGRFDSVFRRGMVTSDEVIDSFPPFRGAGRSIRKMFDERLSSKKVVTAVQKESTSSRSSGKRLETIREFIESEGFEGPAVSTIEEAALSTAREEYRTPSTSKSAGMSTMSGADGGFAVRDEKLNKARRRDMVRAWADSVEDGPRARKIGNRILSANPYISLAELQDEIEAQDSPKISILDVSDVFKTPLDDLQDKWAKDDRIRTSKSCEAAYDGDSDGKMCDGTDDETAAPQKMTRLTVRGRGLLNNSVLDRMKLSDDEDAELIELMDFGLQQPRGVDSDGVFYFTEDGLEKHARMIELLEKAATGPVDRTEISGGESLWESGDGQVAIREGTQVSSDPDITKSLKAGGKPRDADGDGIINEGTDDEQSAGQSGDDTGASDLASGLDELTKPTQKPVPKPAPAPQPETADDLAAALGQLTKPSQDLPQGADVTADPTADDLAAGLEQLAGTGPQADTGRIEGGAEGVVQKLSTMSKDPQAIKALVATMAKEFKGFNFDPDESAVKGWMDERTAAVKDKAAGQLRSQLSARFRKAISAGKMKPMARIQSAMAMQKTLETLSGNQLKQLAANTSAVEVYNDPATLTAAFIETDDGRGDAQMLQGKQVVGVYSVGSKTIRLDGDKLNGRPGVYAHELAHAYDPRANGGSESKGWKMAFMLEIQSTGALSQYATTSPQEGWAEFGRLVSTSPQDAASRFPLSYQVWRKAGM